MVPPWGCFLTKSDGSKYDTDYSNIEYVASNSGQTWTTTTKPILLTSTHANVYAYYPYDLNYTKITEIPIDVTENKDVMWATPKTGIYNVSSTVTMQMNHVLAVISLSLSKGDYSGSGIIESILIQGACMAKTGKLNAKTVAVSITDAGAEIALGSLGSAATLSATAKTVQQLVLPTANNGRIKITVKMDGKKYEVTSPPTAIAQSNSYKYELYFTDGKLIMSSQYRNYSIG